MKKINDLLMLRKPDIDDVEALYLLKNDEETNAQLGGFTTGYSKEDIRGWITSHTNAKDECLYVIVEISSAKLIGHIGLYNIDYRIRKAEFAISIAEKSSRGKGYGELCTNYMLNFGFSQLNLNRIELSLLSTNTIAYKLYKKIGFTHEGILKQAQFKNGNYVDVILMAKFKN
jgi:RimJ/RimL family protein N-acetyltransferase